MATISARVPDEIKRQGVDALRAKGATVSDLVNAAFGYLIQTGELPGEGVSGAKAASKRGPRRLAGAQAEELRRSLDATTFDGVHLEDADLKRVLREGRRRDYEALS